MTLSIYDCEHCVCSFLILCFDCERKETEVVLAASVQYIEGWCAVVSMLVKLHICNPDGKQNC